MKNYSSCLYVLYLLTLIILTGFSNINAQNNDQIRYLKVSIYLENNEQIKQLNREGLLLDHAAVHKLPSGGRRMIAVINESQLQILKESNLSYSILVQDVIENYRNRPQPTSAELRRMENSNGLEGIEFGSMGGYYTFDEVVTELDSMHLLYPDLTTEKTSIGKSIENRDLWMLKISDNPEVDENEPEVFYNGLHHAREPQSMMTVMFFMYYLLENYAADPEVTYLVDNRELYFVPVINPDGYVYNEQTNPDGGGQWRKNRREINGGQWYGVDLNRNYGYQWGYDDVGSSPYPFSDTYRGDAPFSEPETQAIRDFCISRQFELSLSYHSYSNLLIYPWGYEESLVTPDSITYFDYASTMTQYNRYVYGTGDETVNYVTNGDSDDWLYGEQTDKNKILAMTPEVGTDQDGFWPAEERIFPLAEENVYANLYLAWVAGGYPVLKSIHITGDDDADGYLEAGETAIIQTTIENIGRGSAEDAALALQCDDPYVQVIDDYAAIDGAIPSGDVRILDRLTIEAAANTPEAYQLQLIFTVEYGDINRHDTVETVLIGTPQLLFSDNAENGLDNWTAGGQWNLSTRKAVEGSRSFTDSPFRRYPEDYEASLTLDQPVELSSNKQIYLQFWQQFQIERDYDFARVQASTDEENWQTLEGVSGSIGSGWGVQASDQTGYHNMQLNWRREIVDLSSFAGTDSFYVRFNMASDGGTERDGWYIDDIRLLAYTDVVSPLASNETLPDKVTLAPNYPNPFNATTSISFYLPRKMHATLIVYDLLGRKVKTLADRRYNAGEHSLRWKGNNEQGNKVGSGIYIVRLQTEQGMQSRKALLME
ncbi:MAG: T9SS type A sorting domain-containing protein [Caldithrix sp.]|nr:T9SS type A sorting domain-containing protein [Caldithrix sp.]